MSRPRRFSHNASRPLLLILLIPLTLVSLVVVVRVPGGVRSGSRGLEVDPTGRYMTHTLYSYSAGTGGPRWVQILVLDLETERLQQVTEAELLRLRSKWSDGVHDLFQFSLSALDGEVAPGKPPRWQVKAVDPTSGDELRREFSLPGSVQAMTAVGRRFFIAADQEEMVVVDLQRPDQEPRITKHGILVHLLRPISDSNRFLRVSQSAVVTTQYVPGSLVELFELDDAGRMNLLNSWTIGSESENPYRSISVEEGTVASISTDARSVEVRSATDGRLQRSIPLPREFDPVTMPWRLAGRYLHAELPSERKVLDLATEEWLPAPPGNQFLWDSWKETGWLLYEDADQRGEFTVYDADSDTAVSRFRVKTYSWIQFIDADRIAAASMDHGFSVRIVDAATGAVVRHLVPLAWAVPVVGILVGCYSTWCVAWMYTAARAGGPAWLDNLVVVGVPAIALVARAVCAGDQSDTQRTVYLYAQGLFMATVMAAAIWLVFGRTRWPLRVLPLIAITAVLLALLAWIFAEQPWLAWLGTVTTVAPAAFFLIPLAILRASGSALRKRALQRSYLSSTSSPPTGTELPRQAVHLRDLFLVTAVTAALFAAARPIAESLHVIAEMDYLRVSLVYVVLGAFIVFALTMLPTKTTFTCAGVFAVVSITLLTTGPLGQFAGSWRDWENLVGGPEPVISLVCAAATFVLLVPYRWRGWSLTRQRVEA